MFRFSALHRKLFWTDKGSDSGVPPKVSSADMDGGNLKNLYTENLANIGFIAADISARKIYWGLAGTGVVCTKTYLLICVGLTIVDKLLQLFCPD